MLPLPGRTLDGVIAYRDIADTERMIAAAAEHRHAVVIGGGLLGLEAANGLRARGMAVTVIHLMPWLMERQLDRTAADLLKGALEARGLAFRLEAQTEEILGDETGRVRGVKLKSGETLPGRTRGDGGRHPAQHRARRKRRPALQSRHRRQRHAADLRSAHLRRGRVREPSRHGLRARRAAVRDGQGVRQPPGDVRHRPLRRLVRLDQAEGHRHRRLLRRRLHRRRRRRGDRAVRPRRGRLPQARDQERSTDRRRALRRHRRRRVVPQAGARRHQRRRTARPPDVRRGQSRRHRPPGRVQRRGDGRRHGSLRLQRRVQGQDRQAR